jgi:hypothetical protein
MTEHEQKIENLYIHIEGLQATLAERNVTIESLRDALADREIKLAELGDPWLMKNQVIKRAYKDGWKDCAEELMRETAIAAHSLNRLKNQAYESLVKNETR